MCTCAKRGRINVLIVYSIFSLVTAITINWICHDMKVNTIKLEPAFYDANAITYLSSSLLVLLLRFSSRVMENWWWEIDKFNNITIKINKKFQQKKEWTNGKISAQNVMNFVLFYWWPLRVFLPVRFISSKPCERYTFVKILIYDDRWRQTN